MMLGQEARIRLLTEAPEQRRRAFEVGEEKGQGSRGTKPTGLSLESPPGTAADANRRAA